MKENQIQAMQQGRLKAKSDPLEGFEVEKSKLTTSLSQNEKETIIIFNQEDSIAKVCTYQKGLRNKLLKTAKKRPDLVRVVKLVDDGYSDFEVPKKWIKVNSGINLGSEE